MNQKEIKAWYKTFNTFRKGRVQYFAPLIYKELLKFIQQATEKENSVQSAISHLDGNLNSQDLATLIQNIYVDAGQVMGGKAYQLVRKQAVKQLMPIGYNEELVNQIIQYFKDHLLDKAVLPITQTMKEWIFEKLVEAQQKGLSITDAAEAMMQEGFPKNRSIVIARTETIKAVNFGARMGAKKAGYATNKIWISAQDNRTRRLPRDAYSHLAMNGITVDIDEPFMVPQRRGGYDDIQQPGAPDGDAGDTIQCRCTIGFSIRRDANGIPIRL
jgi:uncharacterized protein with gpF-like domain